MISQKRAFTACSHLVGGLAARHRYLIIKISAARGLR